MPETPTRELDFSLDRAGIDHRKVHFAASIVIERYGSRAIEAAEELYEQLGNDFSAAVVEEIRRLTEVTHH